MRPELGAGLWSMFALFVLAGAWLFLRACGTWPVFGWERNYCPADRHALVREVAMGEALQRQIHAAEMTLAEKPLCPVPVPPPPKPTPQKPAPQKPAPTPVAPPPPQGAESKDLDKKVESRRGKRGKLQFTLAWKTLDDLDINIDCPGGRISSTTRGHLGPGVCGDGIKDIDANGDLVRNVSYDPIENVSWAEDVPAGLYRIEIVNYRAKYATGGTVPFVLRMRWGDQERICRDVVTTLPESKRRQVDGRIPMGTKRVITWQSGTDLPDCKFEILNTYRIPPIK